MHSDKCSIIIPVYNSQSTLERCFYSLVNQTYHDIECIFVNDGSTDSSWEILEKLSKSDSRVKIYKKENGGVSSARNFGISKASGKYICFVDSDDTIEITMIEELYNNMILYDCELSICGYNKIYNKNENLHDISDYEIEVIDNKTEFYRNINIYEGFLCNKMFMASYLKKIKLDESIHFCEDELYLLQYVELIDKICYSKKKLYNYYIYSNSGSSLNVWNEKKISVILAREKILHLLNKYDFCVTSIFYIKYFNFLVDICKRYENGYLYKDKLRNVYSLIIFNKKFSYRDRFIVFIKYYFFPLFIALKKLKELIIKNLIFKFY